MCRAPPSSPSLTGPTLPRVPPELPAAAGVRAPDHDGGGPSFRPQRRRSELPVAGGGGSSSQSREAAARAPNRRAPCSFMVHDVSLPASHQLLSLAPSSPLPSHRSRVDEAVAAGSSPQSGDPTWRGWLHLLHGLEAGSGTTGDGGRRRGTATVDDVGRGVPPPLPLPQLRSAGGRRGRILGAVDQWAASLGQWWPAVPGAVVFIYFFLFFISFVVRAE
jgi:hypothetical protein